MIVLPLVATYYCLDVVNDVSCPDKEHSLMQLTGRCTVCLRISMAQGLVLYVVAEEAEAAGSRAYRRA